MGPVCRNPMNAQGFGTAVAAPRVVVVVFWLLSGASHCTWMHPQGRVLNAAPAGHARCPRGGRVLVSMGVPSEAPFVTRNLVAGKCTPSSGGFRPLRRSGLP